MGSSLNKVMLLGNLTRDPETRNTPNSQVCVFGLAVNREWKNRSGEAQKEVLFVDVEVWGRSAEACARFLSKGRQVLVEGRLKLDQWETDQGQKRSKIKVVGENVQFLGGGQKKDSQGGGGGRDDYEDRGSSWGGGGGGERQQSGGGGGGWGQGGDYDNEVPF